MKTLDRRKAVTALFGGLAAVYLFCVPSGAVRFAVAVSGHPLKALTCTVESGFVHSTPDAGVLAFHVENPPVERETASKLRNWAVRPFGPVYIAEYWGYC